MKKIKMIFPDGSIKEIDESDVATAQSLGAKEHTESTKSTSMVFPDGTVKNIDKGDISTAQTLGAKKKVGSNGTTTLAELNTGTNGLPQSTSQLPLQENNITSPKDVFSFDKFSEFHKPETNPKLVVPIVKPSSLAQAHTEDKNFAGYLWNSLVGGFASLGAGIADVHAIITSDDVKAQRAKIEKQRGAFSEQFGVDVTEEEKAAFDENIVTSTAGSLVSMIPAIPGKGVGLFIQAYDMAGQSIEQSPKGKDLPESTKTIYKATVGSVVGAMDRVPIVKLFFGKQGDKVAAGVTSKVLTNLIRTSKVPITAEMAQAAVTAELKSLKNIIIQGGKKVTTGAVLEGLTETGQEGFTMFAEEVLNKTQGEEIFAEQSWKENLTRLGRAAAGGGLGGTALGGLSIPFNKTRDYIAEKVSTAKTQEDIVRLKQELIETASVKDDLSDDEKIQFEKTIDDYVRVNQKIPSDIAQNRVEVSEKIIEREEIQNEVTKKLEEVTSVDDAFKPMVREEMEALKNRSEEINDEIKVLSGIEETATEEIAQPVELSTEVVEKNIAEELRGIKNFISSPNATDEEAISYAQDKVAEAPIEAKDKLGEELYNKVLEQTSTTKLQEGLDYLIKNNLDDPNVDVLDKIISGREKKLSDETTEAQAQEATQTEEKVIQPTEIKKEDIEDVKGVSSNQKNIDIESKTAEWFKEEPPEIKDGFNKFVKDILDNLAEQKGNELSVGFKFSGVEGHKQIDAADYLPEAKPLSEQARKNFSLQGRFYNNAIHVLNDIGFDFDPPSNWMQGNAKMINPKTEAPPLTVKEQEPIKDKEGNPITFYHGTPNKNVSELEPASAQQFGKGIYFAASKESVEDLGDGGKIFEVHLPDKLLEVGKDRIYSGIVNKIEEETGIDPASDKFPLEKVNDEVKKLGYKGLIMDNDTYGGTEAMVFDKKDVIYKDNKTAAPSTVKDKGSGVVDEAVVKDVKDNGEVSSNGVKIISKALGESNLDNSGFEETKVIGEKGKPKQVYHGTWADAPFEDFKEGDTYFTDNYDTAKMFGSNREGGVDTENMDMQGKPFVMEVTDTKGKKSKMVIANTDMASIFSDLQYDASPVGEWGKEDLDAFDASSIEHHFGIPKNKIKSFKIEERQVGENVDDFGVSKHYINIKNPLVIDAKGDTWNGSKGGDIQGKINDARKSGKYDGVIVKNIVEGGLGNPDTKPTTTYVVFNKPKEQTLSNTENKAVKDKQNEPTQKIEEKPETKIGKYEAKVKDFFENTEKKIPSWLINRDPNIKSQGIDLYDILKNASIEVGRLVDTGIELADAIKRGADKLIEDYKKGLGFNSKLKPEFEKQLREGFDNHYRENVLGEEATQNVDNEPPKPPVDDNETETEDEGNGKDKIDDAVSDITETGVVKKYLSGKTIEKYTGEEATNNQNYTATVLKDAFEQGENVIQVAKDVYGKEYVPKMLDYIANSNMSVSQKALLYVTLRNDLYQRRMEATDNNEYASIIKLQELAYSKSQAFAHENAVAMNMWKLQNLQKYGYNIDDTTSSFMSESEMEDRAKIEDAVQVDDDAVNKEADINEDAVVGNETTDFYEDVEKEKAAAKANKPVRKKSSKSKWKAAAADKGKLQDLIDNLKDKINKLNC